MRSIRFRCLSFLTGLVIALSITALLVNFFIYQYPGNNYFPVNAVYYALILLLIYSGLRFLFDTNSRMVLTGLELIYFFGVMSVIALATNAIQLTPFNPIDRHIVRFESFFNISMASILDWTYHNPDFKKLLTLAYITLPYQMCFLPLFVIAMGKFKLLKEYYFLLLFTVLFGFSFYYFFPTTAPASIIKSSLFTPEQIATGSKFLQIHHYIKPDTLDGGLIALPSFHCIWAILCTYLVRLWLIPFTIISITNVLLIMSCVLLGWHYPTDIIMGVLLLIPGFYFLKMCQKSC